MWRVLTWLEILVVAVAKSPTLEASEQMNLLLDAMYMELIYIYIYRYIHLIYMALYPYVAYASILVEFVAQKIRQFEHL